MVGKLKLKHTRESEAVKNLLFRINGVPCEHQQSKLLGGSSVGVKEVRELLERFIAC